MNLTRLNLYRTLGRIAAGGTAAAWLLCQATFGQTIPNPSFEADTFTVSPGYISGNAPITGWTGAPADRVGLNPAGDSPFANNGTIPDGNQVAFIQANVSDPLTPSTLSTTISGLTPGTVYKVTFRANARTGNTPIVKVYIDGAPVLMPGGLVEGFSTAAVAGSNPYWRVAFEFTAGAASQTLSLVNDATTDQTIVVDDFQIAPASGRWAVEPWVTDDDFGADPTFFYTHAYNFGSAADVTVNNVTFTGLAGNAPSVPGKFSTAFLATGPVADTSVAIFGDSAALAASFIYGGNVPANAAQTITLTDLTPGIEYVLMVYTVAWEDPGLGARWFTASVGDDHLTINQDQFFNNNGMRISYRYTADASGSVAIRFAPLLQNTTFHAYGFANREAESRFVAPVITSHPRSWIVSPDLAVNFSVTAAGVPLPGYQWRRNGANITGANDATYSIPSVSSLDAGLYDVIVSNTAGSVTSQVARLTVGNVPIANASFELDGFTVWPGYVSGNWPITGWDALGGHGVNPVQDGTGRSPFADNGAFPHGAQSAFMQADGAMSQIVSGFTVGGHYYVHYYENARGGNNPYLEVKVGGNTLVPAHLVTSVGGANPYREVSSAMFSASATDLELSFIKSNPLGGDNTVLVDNVAIIQVPPGTPPTFSQQPQSTTVYLGQPASFSAVVQGSLPLSYQWWFDGQPLAGETAATLSLASVGLANEGAYFLVVTNSSGSITSAVVQLALLEAIPSLRNTGIDAGGSPQPGGAISPFWTLPVNADSASTDAFVGNEGFPIGTWLNNSTVSKWIGPRANLGEALADGDYVYRTTFDLSNRDTNTVLIVGRWASDNLGTGITVNGAAVNVPQSPSFTAWTSFNINSSNATFLPGLNTIEFAVNNAPPPGPTGLRVEFLQTSARTLPGVPATIAFSPQGGRFVEGDTVVLNVGANGTLPIYYQWRKNNVDLPGQTGPSLTLTAVTTNDNGNYTAVVSNLWGSQISAPATVTIAYRPLPGVVFGTGVDASGQLLADGATDPHYILAASDDLSYPGPDAIVVNEAWPIAPAGPWVANGPDSRWIAPQPDQSGAVGNAQGNYTFQTTFNLTGHDHTKVSLVGSWSVDNLGLDILVNGVSTGITSPGFTGYTPINITSGLVAGVNTLDFLMNNAGTAPSPMGLRVNLRALLDIAPAEPAVTLQVGLSGNTLTISWSPASPGQTLQWAPSLSGPWTDISGAPNPYTTTTTEPARYFRVRE